MRRMFRRGRGRLRFGWRRGLIAAASACRRGAFVMPSSPARDRRSETVGRGSIRGSIRVELTAGETLL